MPLHEYKCRKCGSIIEVLQKSGDAPPKSCQACGGKLQKLLSSPAIHFKGSGWYITDYAKKNSVAATEKTSDNGKAKETKPAPKDSAPSAK